MGWFLLLETGCDVGDAVLHEPRRIEIHKVKGKTIYIYRYSRQKTGIEAIIPIPAEPVEALNNVPLEAALMRRCRRLDCPDARG